MGGFAIMRSAQVVVVALYTFIIVSLVVAPIVPVKEEPGTAAAKGHYWTAWKSPLCWVLGPNPHPWAGGFTYIPGAYSPLSPSYIRNVFL